LIAAVTSLILLAAAFRAARPDPLPVRWGVFAGAAGLTIIAPMILQMFVTAAGILAALLGLSLAVWPRVRHRLRSFAPLAGAAVAVAYGFACLAASGTMARYAQLRAQYPYESMEERVSAPQPAASGSVVADGPLSLLESEVDHAGGGARTRSLRQLHDERVQQFTNSPASVYAASLARSGAFGFGHGKREPNSRVRFRRPFQVRPTHRPRRPTNQTWRRSITRAFSISLMRRASAL
jgi:hypothetical protein